MDARTLLDAVQDRFVSVLADTPGVHVRSPRRRAEDAPLQLALTSGEARALAKDLQRVAHAAIGNNPRARLAGKLARHLETCAWEWENPPETRTQPRSWREKRFMQPPEY